MNKRYAICYNPEMTNSIEVMENLKDILRSASVMYEVLDINNKGNLIVKENEEIKEIFFGEVTLEKIYNKE